MKQRLWSLWFFMIFMVNYNLQITNILIFLGNPWKNTNIELTATDGGPALIVKSNFWDSIISNFTYQKWITWKIIFKPIIYCISITWKKIFEPLIISNITYQEWIIWKIIFKPIIYRISITWKIIFEPSIISNFNYDGLNHMKHNL